MGNRKPGGRTPATSKGSPSTVTGRPTTPGSAPNRRRHNPSEINTTRPLPSRSSSGRNPRPRAGATPRTSSMFAVTNAAGRRSGSPAPPRFSVPDALGRGLQGPRPLRVVQQLRLGQGGPRRARPAVPHRDQAVRLLVRQRLQEHGPGQAEHRGVRADPEGQRHEGGHAPRAVFPHRPEGVPRVLPHLGQVLAGGDVHHLDQRLPQAAPGAAAGGPGVAALVGEQLLHLPAVVRPEVERQQAQERSEPALGPHAVLGLRTSFRDRARARTASMRAASAPATRRPWSVSR